MNTGYLRSSSEPIQSEDKAISLATSTRNRLKGMRRRAAKLLTTIKADSFDYPKPDTEVQGDRAADGSMELEYLSQQLQSSMADGSNASKSCIHHALFSVIQ